jgi:ParB-like chromosome segregation protein Spo0J
MRRVFWHHHKFIEENNHMAKQKTITVAIADLKTNFFVRKELNQDHVLTLADLYDSGVELPPLTISMNGKGLYQLIDGRHRLEALKFLDKAEVLCQVIETDGFGESVSAAIKANIGGSLPPTREDIEHVIKLLLEGNVPRSKLYDLLPFPKQLVRKYMDLVQSELARVRMVQAIDAVASSGYTTPEAAKKFEVDLDTLKLKISGQKKSAKQENVKTMKLSMEGRLRSLSQYNSALCKKVLNQFQDGDITSVQARELFDKLAHAMKQATRVVTEWKARFEAAASGVEPPSTKSSEGGGAAMHFTTHR